MAVDTTTGTRWDELHRDERHRLRYPSEHVVRWLAGLPVKEGAALDIGCGNGRHLALLHDSGFVAAGVDASAEAVWAARERNAAYEAEMTALPFNDNDFDVALAYGVFYYGTMGDADQAVHEMHRVLNPGGHGFISVRTCRDWRADHLDHDGVFHCPGEPEDGMLLDFISEDELGEVYGIFGSVSFEISEWTTHDRDRRNSDWLITVTK